MRTSRWVTACILFTAVVALAWAQQPGGGFGFGFGGPTGLVTNKAVQEDLKLTEDQVVKLNDWAKGQREKTAATMKEKLADIDFKSDEGRAKLAAMNAENTKAAYAELEKSGILKPEQVKRVRQIDRQNQGTRFYTSAEAKETLKLTEEQNAKIKGIVDEAGKDAQAIRTEAGIGGNKGGKGTKVDQAKVDEATKKIEKVNASAREKVNDVLTADQKGQVKDLMGDPFDTSKLRQGFRPMGKNEEE
ncbi:MAG: Spy/CpxP family protein refolding chaperone [Gemmataceae bacterium]|nr:Spy/CpxP family protein refolding chaperone [Gemmataceae bacterium]